MGALSLDENGKCSVDLTKCIGCGSCTSICPVEALNLIDVEEEK
jgi:Fe-S-cluster-containing hydrogenase component 2